MRKMSVIIFITLFGTVFLTSCARQPEGNSMVRLATPSASKIGALAAVPSGRTLCYGVSVKGSGITSSPATSCKPEVGTLIGFVGPSGEIKGEVSKGDGRTFDVYLWVQASGETIACPNTMAGFQAIPANQLYLIGTKSNVKLALDNETIDIATTYPGDAQNLAQVNSYPAACIATVTPSKSGFQVSTSTLPTAATGGAYKLYGRVGRSVQAPTILSGTGFKLKVKE